MRPNHGIIGSRRPPSAIQVMKCGKGTRGFKSCFKLIPWFYFFTVVDGCYPFPVISCW